MPKKKVNKVKITNEETGEKEIIELTEQQKLFCTEYVFDWNGTRSYLVAYPNINSYESARSNASRLLTYDSVKKYIIELQNNTEKLAGISKLKVVKEYQKLAFSSIASLHNTWIEKKEFEELTEEEKSCIQEIETRILKRVEWVYDSEEGKKVRVPVEVEQVKIKLYDKRGALDSLAKMLGYNEPDKIDLSNKDGSLKEDLSKLTTEELVARAEAIRTIKKHEEGK